MEHEKLLSLNQVSERLNVPASTIRWWKFRGKLPFPVYQMPNQRLRFKESEIDEFLRFIERPASRP